VFAAGNLCAAGNIIDTGGPEPEGMVVPFSEQDLEADAEIAAPLEGDEAQLLTEFAHFKQLVNDGAFDEADSVAKRVIELAIVTKGAQSPEMAKALTNLAIVQHRTRQFDAAQQNYQSAIEIIEEVEDRLNEQLVNPLKGLAAAQLDSGRPDLASKTYRRAVHVTHVNDGPHNYGQIGLLEDLSEVQLRMGDLERAKEIQDSIYALNVRTYEVDSLELIPSLMRRGAWQHRAGFIFDERVTYRKVVRIVENKLGRNDLALVEPLVKLGKTFFYIDTSGQTAFHEAQLSTGEVYFKRALRIAAESPDSNWKIIASATLALGDFYMFENNAQRARQVYRNAWTLLSESEDDVDKLEMRRRELEVTINLKQRPLPPFVGKTNPALEVTAEDPILEGTVRVSYNVSDRGRVVNLKLEEAEPPEFKSMQNSVQREVRRRIFRPLFADGEAVASPGHEFVHVFAYRQSALEAARTAAAAAAAASEET
jgi:tetratricopeptide (TPR) repeat protein